MHGSVRGGRVTGIPTATGGLLTCGVAVGMPVTRHPPHRSVRALLTDTALIGIFGVEPVQRMRMYDSWFGQIPSHQSLEALPRPSVALTAPPQRKQPVPRRFPPEPAEPPQIPRYRVIVEISSHHLIQPVSDLPPSLQSLRQFPPQGIPLFGAFSGTTRQSDFPASCMKDVPL